MKQAFALKIPNVITNLAELGIVCPINHLPILIQRDQRIRRLDPLLRQFDVRFSFRNGGRKIIADSGTADLEAKLKRWAFEFVDEFCPDRGFLPYRFRRVLEHSSLVPGLRFSLCL